MVRSLLGLYQQRNTTEYAKLFTGDFTFEFSNAADPNLVAQYSTGWVKDDEITAARNLFEGGTNQDGVSLPAALSINLVLTPTAPTDDNGAGRDPEKYKTLLASVDLIVEMPGGDYFVVGQAPPQSNRFFLVRGDAAVGLEADQPADEDHWYIWNWRDESPPVKPSSTLQVDQSTWGRLKSIYR